MKRWSDTEIADAFAAGFVTPRTFIELTDCQQAIAEAVAAERERWAKYCRVLAEFWDADNTPVGKRLIPAKDAYWDILTSVAETMENDWPTDEKGAEPTTEEPVCEWREEEDRFAVYNLWDTTCGNIHQFEVGGPKENLHTFCPYCGKRIHIGGQE